MTFWTFAIVVAVCYTVYRVTKEIRKAIVEKARAAAGLPEPTPNYMEDGF